MQHADMRVHERRYCQSEGCHHARRCGEFEGAAQSLAILNCPRLRHSHPYSRLAQSDRFQKGEVPKNQDPPTPPQTAVVDRIRVLELKIRQKGIDNPLHGPLVEYPNSQGAKPIACPAHRANSGMRYSAAFVHAANTRRPNAVG